MRTRLAVRIGGAARRDIVRFVTLGFGDLSAAVGLPQALTVLEALLGQIFLVTLVARLVTLWVRQSAGDG